MIVTIAKVADEDPSRVWVAFDWEIEDYERFLSDPEVPAIARR